MPNSPDIFWQLIEDYRPALWRYAYGLTRSRDDANDLVSDTVVAAFQSFPNQRDLGGFKKTLYTIARRLHTRKLWRRRLFMSNDGIEHIPAEEQRESAHDLELLLTALDRLPLKIREALLLFEISGFSLEEIRQLQGGTLSGVKSRLKRGREALRDMIVDRPVESTVDEYNDQLVPLVFEMQRL